MDLGLRGRVAVVTGASRGIGYAAARALAAEGACVAIVARDAARLEAAAAALREKSGGATVVPVALDLFEDGAAARLRERVERELGAASVLVTNAAGPRVGGLDDVPIAEYAPALEHGFLFAARLIDAFLPPMRAARHGRIVHVASISVRQPLDGLLLSNIARTAVAGYAKTVANAVARDGVTVNLVLPGYTRTERLVEVAEGTARREGRTMEDVLAGMTRQVPAGRLGEADELGAVIAFLCSDMAGYVTGERIAVDGGFLRGI